MATPNHQAATPDKAPTAKPAEPGWTQQAEGAMPTTEMALAAQARVDPSTLTPRHIIALQRVAGNQQVARMLTQTRASSTVIQRADDEWNKAYGTHKSFLQLPYEDFKAGLGEIKSTTEGGLTENKGRPIKSQQGAGTPAAPELTLDVLKEIYLYGPRG
jgi:hypothetical protein